MLIMGYLLGSVLGVTLFYFWLLAGNDEFLGCQILMLPTLWKAPPLY